MGFTNDEYDDRKSTMLWLVCSGSHQPVRFGSPPARRRRTDGERLQDSRGRGSAMSGLWSLAYFGQLGGGLAQVTDVPPTIVRVAPSAKAVIPPRSQLRSTNDGFRATHWTGVDRRGWYAATKCKPLRIGVPITNRHGSRCRKRTVADFDSAGRLTER
jgi:hypothetical protein